MNLSVAIPTYGRDQVLLNTIQLLLNLKHPQLELIIVDQTFSHNPDTERQLHSFNNKRAIRWIKLSQPSITKAMNTALIESKGERILFLDDDIVPDVNLLKVHSIAGLETPKALIAGRVLQPWHGGQPDAPDAPFQFNSLSPCPVREFMGGNFSLSKQQALDIGGFDQNFVRVAYRFEAEFAIRWQKAGFPILYQPNALIHHLKEQRGGTRSYGEHLTTLRADHSVGRYYFRYRTNSFWRATFCSFKDLCLSIKTKHHLRRPIWIPITILAETQGMLWALLLYLQGPAYVKAAKPNVLIIGTHPIQYQTPLFKALAADSEINFEVLYISIPAADTQGLGFGLPFTWDIPLLEGYQWRKAKSGGGKGITHGYFGLWVRNPLKELCFGPLDFKPDVVFLTGWHFFGLLQLYVASLILRIPIILRIETNDLGIKKPATAFLHKLLLHGITIGLTIGKANARYYHKHGITNDRLVESPYHIDNNFFRQNSQRLRSARSSLRSYWNIPDQTYCFLYAGKLQSKKRPLDLLNALVKLQSYQRKPAIHLLMVGTGELESQCRLIAKQNNLPIAFAGFLNQTEIVRAYVASDCLVLPSDYGETWGLVVNEAMACGLPAIVSDHAGCCEDLIQENKTGVTYPCGDIDALADRMLLLSSHPEQSYSLGINASTLIRSKYTIDKAKRGILDAINLALAKTY